MKRRTVSKVLRGQDICLFCAFRPRVDQQLRYGNPLPLKARSFTTSVAQDQQAAARRPQNDGEDEGKFSMLKKNADLSAAFPTRAKAKPPPPPSAPQPSQDTLRISRGLDDAQKTPGPSRYGQGDIGQRQQRPPSRNNDRNETTPFRRDNREQGQFRPRNLVPDNERQPNHRYGQERSQGGPRSFGQENNRNTDRRAEPAPGRFQIRRVGGSGETADRGSNNTFERSHQDRTTTDQGSFGSRTPFNRDNRRIAQDDTFRSSNISLEPGREPRSPPYRSQTPGSNREFDSRGSRVRQNIDYNSQSQQSPRQTFPGRNDQGRAHGREQNMITPGSSPVVEDEEAIVVDTIDAPAGSTFDSAFDDRGRGRARKDRGNRRSARFEELEEEEGMEATSAPVQTRTRAPARGFDFELAEAEEMLYGDSGRKKKKKAQKRPEPVRPSRPSVQLPEFVSVERLARILKVNLDHFVRKLEEEGFEGARYDHVLDSSTSSMLADLYGFEAIIAGSGPVEDLVARPLPEDVSQLPPRPPIVTIMGHVDHGKTTILDYLRKSSVVATEHGGITQHIGAFSVTMPGTSRQITFLDTPGHAAFLEMRRRGANVTDIVVLVVAADDSVKPQTVEAIKHALEANVQLIVAINKVDKQDADIERVKQDLTRHDIVVEDYGGDYQVIPLSGKTGQGMDALEEAIITLADVSDFRAETDGPAEGWVLETKVTAAGRVATILVRRGTLRVGDFIVAGTTWARVRTLRNDAGALVNEAPPGTPVQVDGWRAGDPDAGLELLQADNEDHAKDVVDLRLELEETAKTAVELAALNTTRTEDAEARAKVLAWEAEQAWSKKGYAGRPKDNEGWVETEQVTGLKQIPFVIKADVAGSVEAVAAAVVAIGNNEIAANVIHSAVGELTESDIRRLAATGEVGYAINFNQPVDGSIARLAEAANLRILNHNIIYKVTDDVKERLAAELPSIVTQRVVGEAEVGQIFEITMKKSKVKIAGCRVTNGTIARANRVRVLRKGDIIYTGTLHSLKNVKRDVTEMKKGTECGLGFNEWEDFEEGDQIQCFEEHEEKRTLY